MARRKIIMKPFPFDEEAEAVDSYERLLSGTDSIEHFKSGFEDLTRGDTESGVWEADVKAVIDSATLKGLFFSEDWVFIVVDLLASIISSQPLRVMRTMVVDGKKVVEPADAHPLNKVFESPNQYQDYHAWMYTMVVDLNLLGNTILWSPKASKQIITIPAESITMKFNSAGKISAYCATQYSAAEGQVGIGSAASFLPEEIVHIRRPNPSSMLWGLSPFIPGRKSVLFNRYSSEYLNSFYLKGATPGLALEMDKEANEKVILRLLRSFEAAHTGRRNQRRTMILPKGVTAKQVASSLADQSLIEYVNSNRETILGLMKVPKHALSLQTSGSLGSEEYKQAMKNMWSLAIKPAMAMISGSLTKYYASMLGPNHLINFDLSDVEALQENEDDKASLSSKLLSTHTLNEVRKKVYNMPPLEGGDLLPGKKEPQAGGGFLPFGLSAQAPQQNALYSEKPSELTPAAGVTSDEGEAESKTTGTGRVKAENTKLTAFLKSNEGWWDKREQTVSAGAKKGVNEIERLSLETFADMAAVIISTTSKYLKQKGFLSVGTKATETSNPQVTLVKRNELRRRLRSALDRFEDKWVDKYVSKLIETVELGYDSALQIPFALQSKDELAAIRQRMTEARRDELEDRASRAFKYINETTLEDVFWTVEKGIQKGLTIDKIAESLRDRFSDVEEIGARAMTIARTEVLSAVSLGQAASMKDAATVIPNLKKMWLTSGDDRVRDSHDSQQGEVVDWDGQFSNGLSFPRDPSGPAGEVINCRCTWITLPEDQMSDLIDSEPTLEADEV